ncbi:MAG: sigma-70 family RNA polymerase sigma factor [Acidobacteriota bacterium]
MVLKTDQVADSILVSQACAGDEDAFAEIVRRYSPRVFRIVSRFFRRPTLVEELAQDVFLKAYTHLSDYEGRGSLEGWLSRIATSVCLNALRSARQRPESSLADLTEAEAKWLEASLSNSTVKGYQDAEKDLIAADLADKLFRELSEDDRVVLTFIEGDGLSVKETATLTGWSQAKVKVQLFRARRRMRKVLEELLDSQAQRLVKS